AIACLRHRQEHVLARRRGGGSDRQGWKVHERAKSQRRCQSRIESRGAKLFDYRGTRRRCWRPRFRLLSEPRLLLGTPASHARVVLAAATDVRGPRRRVVGGRRKRLASYREG